MRFSLLLFVIAGTGLTLIHTPNFSIGLCSLACCYLLLVYLRDFVLNIDLRRPFGSWLLTGQAVIALAIAIASESFFAQIYLLILIGEFTLYRAVKPAIAFTIGCYCCAFAGVIVYRDFPPLSEVYILFPRIIDYFAIFGMGLLARIAIQQRNRLEHDNEQLRLASIELEHQAKLQERTRISRDIHDSVGHTLTSAITGLQTAAFAIERNNAAVALEMVNRTNDSIRRGLNDVRSSVRLLREGLPGESFIPELVGLIEETSQQTDAAIDCEIDPALPELTPQVELTIYRALQEGLTNGIRHGSSTQFRFVLKVEADAIRFVLADNGRAPKKLVPGFGLRAMRERVEDVGGEWTLAENETGGMTLQITIPYGEIRAQEA